MENLDKQYSPLTIEPEIYRVWENKGCFTPAGDGTRRPYVIVIPPPNITGFLHMGHALNNTIQDVLIRWRRMDGYDALWLPGTDHAGIATQNVVERDLAKKGLTRKQLGRQKFVEEVWRWRETYGSRIIFQLKRLGASCDWTRLRFTMDEMLSRAVREAFVRLYRKDLIYRGQRIIHWCPRCTTALADEEVEYRDEDGHLYFIRYPIVPEGFIEVATTRPETMLGDTAVAVHPSDHRYQRFVGMKVNLPFVNRLIPVLADDSVDPEFGTGAVKVTPSHDANDFVLGVKHNLEFVTVMTPEGKMNENAGQWAGLDRFDCREKLVEALREKGLLSRIDPYQHRLGRCYRCHTVVEPYLSQQWFVRMAPLAKPAIVVAEENTLHFYPERWKKVYLNWLYNIKDWCISRQIWWGHRIPVWYCENQGCCPIVQIDQPQTCPQCGGNKLQQDKDVLDTWFSSWLWPFSVFGWPEKTKDLTIFYPTDTLVTAPEILFFWVARMVMAGLEFTGQLPFENIYIHGTVRDKTGRKMSKSLGNAIDPVEIIDNCGADSLRFSLISMTSVGQDVFLSPSFYVKGRNFCNKLWNASRFVFLQAEKYAPGKIRWQNKPEIWQLSDRWIISQLNHLLQKQALALEEFRLNEALNELYDFFWHRFCDWYIEIVKLSETDQQVFSEVKLPVLLYVLKVCLQCLHPFIPFVTEKLWSILINYLETDSSLVTTSHWPHPGEFFDPEAERVMTGIIQTVTLVREIKTTFNLPLKKRLDCYFQGPSLP
ncbi:MAG: valine--tRNA ligase, partial [Candidatus Omnitrophica bacterium]|nr:valine--tRNA ligase [Candidatus Omnitrophota bacterium]